MKEGDIVMAYGNPIKQTVPLGKAKLISKKSEYGKIENWVVQFLHEPTQTRMCLIKKENNGTDKA